LTLRFEGVVPIRVCGFPDLNKKILKDSGTRLWRANIPPPAPKNPAVAGFLIFKFQETSPKQITNNNSQTFQRSVLEFINCFCLYLVFCYSFIQFSSSLCKIADL
jgi:hypothetical protein